MAAPFGELTVSEIFCRGCDAVRPVAARAVSSAEPRGAMEFVCGQCGAVLARRTETKPSPVSWWRRWQVWLVGRPRGGR